jgi:hypothetical protein
MSTPLLAPCVMYFSNLGFWGSAFIANLIGGLIFFWIDRLIFKKETLYTEQWEVKHNGKCICCNYEGRVYRLIKAPGYDRTNAPPLYRCESCSIEKYFKIIKN